jgi:uncharacterized short protein YbdD (DUF466 family)
MGLGTRPPNVTTASVRRFARRAGHVMRRILGVPDYDRYVAHLRARHPDSTPVPRERFVRQRLEERYSTPGGRCC